MSFKSVVNAITEQCQEIKQALILLPYFENWEPDLIAECCRVSSIAEFQPEDIILGPETGESHMVYFILEGICQIIQNLYVEIKSDFRQQNLFKLCTSLKAKSPDEIFKNERYCSGLFNNDKDFQAEGKFKVVNSETESLGTGSESPIDNKNQVEKKSKILHSQIQESKQEPKIDDLVLEQINSAGPSENESETIAKNLQSEQKSQPKGEIIYESDHHRRILQECKKKHEETIRVCKKITVSEKPPNVETVFMQIGFLFRGACFGLDNYIKHTFMSSTRVKCLKIPQGFLLQHNPCNIWNRIRLFYSIYLPKDEKIFECFQSDRRWTERKKRQTEEIIYLKNLINYTSINDVPYSIRLTCNR